MMKKMRVLLKLSMIAAPLYARFSSIDSKRELQRKLPDYPYIVACLHNTRPEGERLPREDRKEVRDVKQALEGIADSPDYKKMLRKDVGFFWIDLGDKDNHEIPAILKAPAKPTCVLLDHQKPIAYMAITDKTTQIDLLNFINKHLGDKINALIEAHQDAQERERQERIERYRAYASRPYFAYDYYPWGWNSRPWGWGGYYGRPGFGFGVML